MITPNEDIKFTLKAMQTNRMYKPKSVPLWLKIFTWLCVILLGVAFWGGLYLIW